MASLKSRFEELIHLEWGEFCELEKNKGSNVDDVVLCSLIRSCADTDDIASIKMAFDRLDGLQETPIEIKVPKFYIRYTKATEVEGGETKQIEAAESTEKDEPSDYDPATAKLRETLKEMRRMPRDVIRAVKLYKRRIEKGTPVDHQPMVKSVIVANLLKHVSKGRFRAIELVFDQIDGKLTRTIALLGGKDVIVDDHTTLVAPEGSILGEDGKYLWEDPMMKASWLRGFAQSQKGLEILAEGLGDE